MGLVPDVGGAGVGRPAVGFDCRARGDIGGDEAMQRGGGEVLDHGQAKASGRGVFNFDGAGDQHFAPGSATAAAANRIRPWHLQSYLDEFVFRFNGRRTRHAAFRSLFLQSPLSASR